jgi:hypothetical protein
MSIVYHCILSWEGQANGSKQFDLPYFYFRPLKGHLVIEDRFKYRSDDEQISKAGFAFSQISVRGEISFPVPAENTDAVFALKDSLQNGKGVTFVIGLLQTDESGASKPLHVGLRLVNARVVGMYARKEHLVGDSHQLFYLTSFKAPPPKPGSMRSFTAPG